jgi:hypothetical protein
VFPPTVLPPPLGAGLFHALQVAVHNVLENLRAAGVADHLDALHVTVG